MSEKLKSIFFRILGAALFAIGLAMGKACVHSITHNSRSNHYNTSSYIPKGMIDSLVEAFAKHDLYRELEFIHQKQDISECIKENNDCVQLAIETIFNPKNKEENIIETEIKITQYLKYACNVQDNPLGCQIIWQLMDGKLVVLETENNTILNAKKYAQLRELYLYEKECYEKGNAYSCYNAGSIYLNNDYTDSLNELGEQYKNTNKNKERANKLFTYGCHYQNKENICTDLDMNNDENNIHKIDQLQSMCLNNNQASCYYLGYIYEYGIGVDINLAKAHYYHKINCDNNNGDSCNTLYRLSETKSYQIKACNLGVKNACTLAPVFHPQWFRQ